MGKLFEKLLFVNSLVSTLYEESNYNIVDWAESDAKVKELLALCGDLNEIRAIIEVLSCVDKMGNKRSNASKEADIEAEDEYNYTITLAKLGMM